MVRKPYLQPYIMDVPMGQVVLVDVRWRDGRKLPREALALLGYGSEAEALLGAGNAEEAAPAEREASSAERPPVGKKRDLDGAGAHGVKKTRRS